jgi:glycosyltransferase involved in cell wall biosynthesis
MKVSIIIPVYNTEQYLSRCIDSILGQSFTDFELLLIDDGSTDGSAKICDAYTEKDSRIRVLHKENGGVSSARNLGLNEAKGDWVSFVDSDDELLPNGLQAMADGISDEVSMVMAGYHEYEDDRLTVDTSAMKVKGEIIDRNEALVMMYPSGDKIYMGYSVGKLFNKDLVKLSGITFNEHIAIKEDTLFVVEYLCQSEKPVHFTSSPVYKYMKITTGAMGSLSVTYNPKYLTSFDAVVEMNRLIQKLPNLGRNLSNVAKYEVVNRCYLIYGHMLQNNAVDKGVVSDLKKKAIKEVGLFYYIGYQYRRSKRRIKNFLWKKSNIK